MNPAFTVGFISGVASMVIVWLVLRCAFFIYLRYERRKVFNEYDDDRR